MTTRHVATIAALTVREIARRRVLWVLAGLAVGSVALVGFGVERLVSLARADGVPEVQLQIGVSQVLILIAFMFSFVLAMSAAFLAAPAIAGDVESGVALALLARPISRAELLLGRWVGLTVVVGGYTVGSGLLAIAVVWLVSGYLPPLPFIAVGFLAFEATLVMTLALALGTRLPGMAAGAVSVVAFGLAWFGGVLGGIAAVFEATALVRATELLRVLVPTDALWRGVVYGLEPPLAVLLARGMGSSEARQANPFFADAPPSAAMTAWSVAWIVIVLAAGAWAFRRRQL